jgi:hypothetical protein
MSHALDRSQGTVTLSDRDDRARRAVKAFRAMQPTLSAYARVLTRNPRVQVVMDAKSNGMTDGQKIFFRPPIELGDKAEHVRKLCDKRDENKLLLCAACNIRERVLITIYHEIAHIAYDTFAPVDDYDKAEALKSAIQARGSKYAEKLDAAVKARPSMGYQSIAGLVSKYLPMIVNALEDARIEARMFEARKGTRIMFEADNYRTFTFGVEGADPTAPDGVTVKQWRDTPLDAQATVALYVGAARYDYTGWFHPDVEAALADDEVKSLLLQVQTARSVAGVYHVALPVLARMRQLGFFRDDYVPEDEDPEPEPEPEQQEEESDEDPGSDGDDQPENDDDADDSEGGDSSSESSSDPADGDGEPDESEDDGGSDATDDDGESGEGEPDDGDDGTGEPDDATPGTEGAGEPGESDDEGADVDESSDEGSPGDGDPEDGDEAGGGDASSEARDGDGDDSSSDDSPDREADGASGVGGSAGDPQESEEEVDDDFDTEGSPEGHEDPDDLGTGEPGGDSDDRDDDLDSASGGDDGADSSSSGMGAEGDLDEPEGDADLPEPDGQPSAETGASTLGDGRGDGEELDNGEDLHGDIDEPLPVADQEVPKGEGDGDEIDTEADQGEGGITVKGEIDTRPEQGDPDAAEAAILKFLDHEEKPPSIEVQQNEAAVEKAILQGFYFESPSVNIHGVREHYFGQPNVVDGFNFSTAWERHNFYGYSGERTGRDGDFTASEQILGPALLKTRRAFTDNARGSEQTNLKSGKVNARVLGKRAHSGDDRLFLQRRQPGKRSYFVVIMMDISGSTVGANIRIMKQAVFAQAMLLHRAGVPFAIYAQSGQAHSLDGVREMDLEIYVVKQVGQPWDVKTQDALTELGPDSMNLDGHALEYARKRAEEVQATDRIILFYSDGKMPAANYEEELEILQREIKYCRRKGITLLGVGIRTDSPRAHGLETVQLDSVEETGKVTDQLKKYLARKTTA